MEDQDALLNSVALNLQFLQWPETGDGIGGAGDGWGNTLRPVPLKNEGQVHIKEDIKK
jgi:hypothetical protein